MDVSSGSTFDLEVDHEKFAGEVIADPWADKSQIDWPQNEEVKYGLDSDEAAGKASK